jgi:hypothetical protein
VVPDLPSKDYRHHPNDLWAPPSDVYRLISPPIPCTKSEVIRTNSAGHPAVMQHVKRAGANSSGARPVWELLEGHAFFKEKWIDFDVSSQKGRKLGPVVFPTVKVQQPSILSPECVHPAATSFNGSHSSPLELEMLRDTYLVARMTFQPSKSQLGLLNPNPPTIYACLTPWS